MLGRVARRNQMPFHTFPVQIGPGPRLLAIDLAEHRDGEGRAEAAWYVQGMYGELLTHEVLLAY